MASDALQSQRCAEMLKALGDPLRLKLIDALREGPRNVSHLADALAAEMVLVSHHLGILYHAGLLEREKQGRFVVYRLKDGVLAPRSRGDREHLDLGCCRLEIPRV
jgi:DNA-binding transcriptional ArsR family regulator